MKAQNQKSRFDTLIHAIACVLLATSARADLAIAANFDSGSIGIYSINEASSAMMMIGDGGGTSNGPNSTYSERFTYMSFWCSGGGGEDPADTMTLIAAEQG